MHIKTPVGAIPVVTRGAQRRVNRKVFAGFEVVCYVRGNVRDERFELLGFRHPEKPEGSMLFALIGNVLVVRDGDGMESGYCVGDLTSLMRVAATPRALYGRAAVISGPRQVDRATLHHAALRLAVHRLDKDRKP